MSLGLDLVICPVLCFFYCYCDHRDLHVLTHSFPTRRSSDLTSPTRPRVRTAATTGKCSTPPRPDRGTCSGSATSSDPGRFVGTPLLRDTGFPATDGPSRERPQLTEAGRSEEHTSELQSLMRNSYAAFCLKKKKITKLTKPNKHT